MSKYWKGSIRSIYVNYSSLEELISSLLKNSHNLMQFAHSINLIWVKVCSFLEYEILWLS